MRIKLNEDEVRTLLKYDFIVLTEKQKIELLDNKFIIFEGIYTNKLSDFCEDKMIEVGFGENYNLNFDGVCLQSIIDKIYIEEENSSN